MCVLHHPSYFNSICHDNVLGPKPMEKEKETKQLRQGKEKAEQR